MLSVDGGEYDEIVDRWCYPYIGDMKSTNEIDAMQECSRNTTCYMFYQAGDVATVFRSCENTAEIKVSSIGSILYQPKGNKICIANFIILETCYNILHNQLSTAKITLTMFYMQMQLTRPKVEK